MPLDDLVLRLQRLLDRLVRRLRLGRAPEATARRVLIVQIDGLSRSVLEQGLADGTAPFLARLLRQRRWRFTPMSVGLPTSRSADGPLCFWRGKRYRLDELGAGPFAGRDDLPRVVEGVRDLTAMASADDLMVYGIDAPEGHVSFVPEVGAHAGTSYDELHTFVIHPPAVTLPSPIIHPIELYAHFMRFPAAA